MSTPERCEANIRNIIGKIIPCEEDAHRQVISINEIGELVEKNACTRHEQQYVYYAEHSLFN